MSNTVNTAEIRIVADASGVEAGLRQATAAADRAEQAIAGGAASSARSQQNLIQAIQRTTAQMESGGRAGARYYEILAQQRGVNPQALEPYLQQLRAVERAHLNNTNAAFNSARQQAAAMRMVPAQLTDIAVSLQGGQNPLTVLLQQGGQLRDMFGSVGGAARALGGQLLALVNPYTVAAAAAAGLGYAYYAGSREARDYNLALINSGNAAGASAGQMADAAAHVAKFTGSQSEAAKVIAELAGSGVVAAGALASASMAAINAQRDLGREVGKTVEEFVAIGKDPVKALEELSKKYRGITAETFAQVKALQDQGRMQEAATLAQQAHADSIEKNRHKVIETLTDWERGWRRISEWTGKAVDGAADYLLNFGRQQGPQEKISALLKERDSLEETMATARARRDTYQMRLTQAQLDLNRDAINAERAKGDAAKKRAADEEKNGRAEAMRIEIAKGADSLMSRAEQRDKKLAAERQEAIAAGLKEAEVQQYVAIKAREYKDVDEDIKRKREEASRKAQEQIRREASDMAAMVGVQTDYMEKLDLLQKKRAAGVITEQRYVELVKDLIAQQPGAKKMMDDQQKAQEASDKLAEDGIKAAQRERDSIIEQLSAQRSANEEMGITGAALGDLRAKRLEAAAAQKLESAAAIEAFEPGSKLAQLYRDQAAAMSGLAVARRDGAAAQEGQKALEDLNKFLDPARAQNFGEALREAFGSAGTSLSRLTATLDGFGKRQAAIDKARADAVKARDSGQMKEIDYLQAVSEINRRDTRERLAGYGDMASAAAGFFGEQSKGYQALMTVSKVFHAAELAMTMAELVPKAISAVLTQGTGDPYTAFGRMAAMAAIVAGLGVAIGGVSGGGVKTSETRQKEQGTGTVLGSNDKSESINRSLQLIQRATFQNLSIASGMLAALRNIESNIGNFASLLVRTTGLSGEVPNNGLIKGTVLDGKAFGTASSLGGAVAGGLFGGAAAGAMTMGVTGSMSTTMLGAIAGPIGMVAGALLGAVLGKSLGKLTSKVFGGQKFLEDVGLSLGNTSLGDVEAGNLNAQQFSEIKKKGGWFRSDKYYTEYQSLGNEANRQFSQIIMSMADTIKMAAVGIGINGDDFSRRLDSFVVSIGKISLKGKSGEEIQKELEAVFSKMGDDMARFGVAGLEQFQKVGEGYLETLTRVSAGYQAVTVITEALGMSFNAVGVGSIGARERLIELAGGLEEFASGAEKFLTDFYSDAEQADALRKRISPTLDKYGIQTGGEDALKQFRNVVTGLDLTTAAGAEAYSVLMQIAPAFKQIADLDAQKFEERKGLQGELDQLLMTEAQLLAKRRNELDASNRALFDQVQAAKKAKEAQDAAKSSLGDFIGRMKSFATSVAGLNNSLVLGATSVLTPEQQYAEARRQFEQTAKKAAAGDATAQGNLSAIEQTFLQLSQKVNGGDAQYASDLANVIRTNDELAKSAGASVDVAQASLDVLNGQAATLTDIHATLTTIAQGGQLGGPVAQQFAQVDYSRMGTLDMVPLVEEVKALREEVKLLRADQNRQTGDMIQATGASARDAANVVVSGVREAVSDGRYSDRFSTREYR
jgi:hypothetical protein